MPCSGSPKVTTFAPNRSDGNFSISISKGPAPWRPLAKEIAKKGCELPRDLLRESATKFVPF